MMDAGDLTARQYERCSWKRVKQFDAAEKVAQEPANKTEVEQ